MRNALIAAVVAAVVAAAGGTAATIVITSKNIKNGTIQTVDISAQAKRALKGTRGPRGFQGAPGVPGASGPAGPKGDKGATGEPWTLGGVVPSGKTLRGVYAPSALAEATGEFEHEAISFGFVFPSKPVAHYISLGDAAPAECPGTVHNPQATGGHLCVYESLASSNAGTTYVFNPVDDTPNEGAVRGFGIYVESTGPGPYWVQGSWAVTAP